MTSLLSPVHQTSTGRLQSCCLPVICVILHGILCCVSHKGHIISLNSCKETGVPAHLPLAAGEPEGASDPLFCEQAGERIPMLLRWLLEQVLQKKQETKKQRNRKKPVDTVSVCIFVKTSQLNHWLLKLKRRYKKFRELSVCVCFLT